MRTKPLYFKDAYFSNAEGTAHEINVKPTATAPAELQLYSHIKVIPYSSTKYKVVKWKLKAGGATKTPTTQTLINISDVTVEAKHEHKKHDKVSNAEGHHGERREYGYAEGGVSKTPSWAKFLFIPGVIFGGVLAHHFSKGKTFEGKAKYIHYGTFIFGGALLLNIPQIFFEFKSLSDKRQ